MTLNVILKLKKSNQYSKFNGLTFRAISIGSFISIKGLNEEFPDACTDFYFGEFIICNLQELVDYYRENYCLAINTLLVNYCINQKINVDFAKDTHFYDQVKRGVYF